MRQKEKRKIRGMSSAMKVKLWRVKSNDACFVLGDNSVAWETEWHTWGMSKD